MVPEEKVLEVEIEPGMRDGQEYPFVAEGMESYGWVTQPYYYACLKPGPGFPTPCCDLFFMFNGFR